MKFLLGFLIIIVIAGCTTIKEISKTEIQIEYDTIYVVNPAWEDSVKGFWEDSLTVVGVFLDSLSSDTTVVVKYIPGKTTFKVKYYPDTITVIEKDTVRITTTTLTEEPTFLEQYWWIFLIVAAVILIVVLKR